jgi:hypothetical protein
MRARTRLFSVGSALALLVLTALAAAWAGGEPTMAATGGEPSTARPDAQGRLVLNVKDGKQWRHSYRVMLVAKVVTEPQMAFWLEDTAGNFVATIFVTHRSATDDWRASLGQDKSKLQRPSALPVWRRKHREGGVHPPSTCTDCHARRRAEDKSTDGIGSLDAITGATPPSGFTRDWPIPEGLKPGVYVLKAEINQSRDFTDVYRANLPESDPNYSGGKAGSGQPSLVWQGTIDLGGGAALSTLKPLGHGHPAGANGEVSTDLSTLTTALDIVESIKVSYIPAQ